MRRTFAAELHFLMKENESIWLITADLGFGMFDKIREDFPSRFINTGSSEQAAADISCGLSIEGKTVFLYTITPFFYRCAETLRYANHERIKIICVGSGRDDDYAHDGPSHFSFDSVELFNCFPLFQQHYPESKEEIPNLLKEIIQSPSPSFISLKR